MFQTKLNSAQQQAVEYNDGPLLIVAGAGTGKTTVITQKIAHLIETGNAKPEEILALTFTDKAAAEMQERVDESLQVGYANITIGTFHRFCQDILEEYALHVGLPRRFKLLTDTDAWLLLHDHLYDLPLTYYRPLGNPTSHVHELLRHFSKCKDELITPEDYLQYANDQRNQTAGSENGEVIEAEMARLEEIANVYQAYNQLLLKESSLDFGDLIFYTVKLLQERPAIQEQIQRRYKYVLVDEFQDVNYAQYALVRLLVGAQNLLTVVGDDDQSIYAFRGASVSNILRFKEDFPTAKEVVLSENYRSAQEILDLAYQSIQENNPDRLEKKLNIDKRLVATKNVPGKNHVVHLHSSTLEEEVNAVIQEIQQLQQRAVDFHWDDVAILVRANGHAEPFLHGLERAGIPYEFLAASGLYRQSIVIDSFNFFKAITSYHESNALFRLLLLPPFQFDQGDLQTLMYHAKKKSISYFEAIGRAAEWKLSNEGVEICERLRRLLLEGRQRAKEEKPTVVLLKFLEESGYLRYFTEQEEKGNLEVVRQVEYLRQFLEFIARYEQTKPDATVYHFVEYYSHMLQSGDDGKLYQPTDTPESVNVMTVHASKGLEFRYVFVVNLVEERFPTRRRGEGIDLPQELIKEQLPEGDYHYQEERRLFYVATTRAKERLYLTSADNYGGVRQKKISRFLHEVGLAHKEMKKRGNNEIRNEETGNKEIKKRRNMLPVQPAKNSSEAIHPSIKNNNIERVYKLPKSFSFSQIQTYQTCPYKYKLAHIIKVPTKSSGAFSFGSTMHVTLQRFYERVQEMNGSSQPTLFTTSSEVGETATVTTVQVPTLDELLSIFERSWIDDWYESKQQREQYKAKGNEILRVLYAAQEGQWTVPVALEESFKISIGGNILTGRIDRIDQLTDGTLEIVDYKTGKTKEKLTGDDKDQLLIYQIAATTIPSFAHLGSVGKLTFYYLNDNVQTSFVGKDKEIEKLKEKLLATLHHIHDGEFSPTPSSFVCSYCDYRDICEYRA